MCILSVLQQIFLTQELNQGLLHCRRILYQLRYQGSPPVLLTTCISVVYLLQLVNQYSGQSLSPVRLLTIPWTVACQSTLSITSSQRLLKFMSIESLKPSNYLILCCPPLLLPSIFPSTRVLINESLLHTRWPKYWSFSFSISPSNEYSGLISFRMDWLHLLAVQGTLKSLLQHHSSKALIL